MSLSMKSAGRGLVANGRQVGDPGLFGFLGKVGKSVLGGAVGLATGGIGGAVTGAIGGFRGSIPQATTARGDMPILVSSSPGRTPVSGGLGLPPRSRPGVGVNPPFGGAPGVGLGLPGPFGPMRVGIGENGSGPVAVQAGMKLACPSGFRPNKSAYFLKSGQFVPKGTRCVRIRRRNPLNPTAASNAMKRLEQAKRASKQLSRVTIRKQSCN